MRVESAKDKNGYEMVNVDIEDPKKSIRPLHKAARDGNLEALKTLLARGNNENVLEIDDTGSTLLHHTAYLQNFEKAIACSQLLISFAVDNLNRNGIGILLDTRDLTETSPIGLATARGNAELIELLLDAGASLKVPEGNETVFHILAKLDNQEHALNCIRIVSKLKYYGNSSDELRNYLNQDCKYTLRSPIHLASIHGNHLVLEELILQGADPSKVDYVNCNIFHHSVGNAYEKKATDCIQVLMKDDLIQDWGKIRHHLLESFDISGRCPIHIGARRGFPIVLRLLKDFYFIAEGKTGYTPLHAAASLGDEEEAGRCVREILSKVPDDYNKSKLCNSQDVDGCTPLYLSAKERNVEACKLLLLAGSGFDIKTKRGKTPLEKVYQEIPEAVSVLLDKAVKNSGYVAHLGTIKVYADLDFGPILGYSTSQSHIYKETEELTKICKANFESRKQILLHPFIKIYIHQKWEKVKWSFRLFRFLHILWFFLNCFFVLWMYRDVCPIPGAKNFTWKGLRPLAGDDAEAVSNKTLAECQIPSDLRNSGIVNFIFLFIYLICQFHESMQRFHLLFRSVKTKPNLNFIANIFRIVFYYVKLLFTILPTGHLIIGIGIGISILPTLGILVCNDFGHYFIAGLVGLGVWIGICLEVMKIPAFSFYKNLLFKSGKTLLIAIVVTAPILLGFAALFSILIPAEPAFSSPLQSLVKVMTFMIGELDYGSLVYGETESRFMGWIMLFMALFVITIVVLLVNFLIGLAAEEISDVWDRSVIWSLCTKLEQIHTLESFLDEQIPLCGHQFLRQHLMLMPPDTTVSANVLKQQRRVAMIKLTTLPKDLQKEFHQLRLNTIVDVK